MFGLCATALVTDVIQLSTGYHAPFFLTVCQPNYSHVSCDTNAYVSGDICSGHDQQAIAAARCAAAAACAAFSTAAFSTAAFRWAARSATDGSSSLLSAQENLPVPARDSVGFRRGVCFGKLDPKAVAVCPPRPLTCEAFAECGA